MSQVRNIGFAALVSATLATPAVAQDNGPVIAIPGRRDVPVFVNGREASYAVVESDWGLYRAGWLGPNVIQPMCCGLNNPAYNGRRFVHFYPSSGHLPGVGRLEYDPDKNKPPQPAPAFHESWSAKSQDNPATIMPPDYSYDMPGVVVTPGWDGAGPGPGP
ncbi:hypothetical protein, partial [Rhodoplanes roseus]|uniref:hypothetical protein n=1 Tax=Rhodoplanes roseus TaxID=29409 RepID=UPI000DAC9EB1